MSKGITIGNWKIKPRFIIFIFILAISISLLYKYSANPPVPYAIEAGNMHLEYESEAIIIRDESIYNAPEYGRVAHYTNEGELVDKGEHVATIYKSDYQEEMVYQLYNVQEKIINYQNENILSNVTDKDLESIQANIDDLTYQMQANIKNNRFDKLAKGEKEFRTLLARRQELIEKKTIPDSYLEKLEEEESRISQQLKEWKIDIEAPRSGLVSYHIDNLEDVLTFNALDKISLNSYRDLINWKSPGREQNIEKQAGLDRPFVRIVNPRKWYIVCKIDYSQIFFRENESILISFLDFEDKTLEGKVRGIVDGKNEFLLVIEFENCIEDFLNVRNTSVRINKSVNGLVVPKNAIVSRGSEKGAFKIQNNGMEFTNIDIIAESENEEYVIIDEATSHLKEGDIIKLR